MVNDSQTVNVRVQVVDLKPFTLDLQVPNYLPARDLTQRIARDAGLEAYWDDGRRRLYWLRARGRLVDGDETLMDLSVVDGELVYLLPEPPAGTGVVERPPEYPENRGYRARGTTVLLGSAAGALLWTIAWGVAMGQLRNNWTVAVPAVALGLMTTSFARHAWSGRANRVRIPLTSLGLVLPCLALALTISAISDGAGTGSPYSDAAACVVFGFVGVMIGWLAWWGAVEPLPAFAAAEPEAKDETSAVVTCAICGTDVLPDVRTECSYACGRFFHTGCYRARMAVDTSDASLCGICTAPIG
jgi:uncharacterized ubiquitin-like protein YukD